MRILMAIACVITKIKPSAFFRPISVDKKLIVLACYGSLKSQTVTVNRHFTMKLLIIN